MYSMHVSIAASICFWIAGTLFPYCWACTTKHDCNKNESAKNFAIFCEFSRTYFFSLGGQRNFYSLYRVANWTRPHLHWRRNLQFHYIEKMTFRFLIMKLAISKNDPNPKSLRLQFWKTGSIFNNKNRPNGPQIDKMVHQNFWTLWLKPVSTRVINYTNESCNRGPSFALVPKLTGDYQAITS